MSEQIYYARQRISDGSFQLLKDHLNETAELAADFAEIIGLSSLGFIAGVTHDSGKGTPPWLEYLLKSISNQNHNEKIPHATAGGEYIASLLTDTNSKIIRELLVMCVMYHHGSGLPDMIDENGNSPYLKRLNDSKPAAGPVEGLFDERIHQLLMNKSFVDQVNLQLGKLIGGEFRSKQHFFLGLVARYLSSCLIDADRTSSADFEMNVPCVVPNREYDWQKLLGKLKNALAAFADDTELAHLRKSISDSCALFGQKELGLFTLSAATGSGKTLASLLFALIHALTHHLSHIFIIAPYTSILDQNAKVIRDILEAGEKENSVVLECHSNIAEDKNTDEYKSAAETWDAPVVITTMVQFLESIYGSGTKKIRRMHELANSIIIFDEAQTIPVKCTFLFNRAVQFLTEDCHSSVLLCTATQPALDTLDKEYCLEYTPGHEIISDIKKHFSEFKRVDIIDKTRAGGYTTEEVSYFVCDRLDSMNSVLVVTNTKGEASELYDLLASTDSHVDALYHLSTNMCPAHRKKVIQSITTDLKAGRRIVCVSTRLIEAGVDLSFNCAIRYLAGFDSIAQTAGRCNRNGEMYDEHGNAVSGQTFIVNIKDESLGSLDELKIGQHVMERILREYKDDIEHYHNTLLNPELLKNYFTYYYAALNSKKLAFPVEAETIVNLLGENKSRVDAFCRKNDKAELPVFNQSFESAWKQFEVIEKATIGVIAPYEDGIQIAGELSSLTFKSAEDFKTYYALMKKAQQYTVNVYYSSLETLLKLKIIRAIQVTDEVSVYVIEEGYYNKSVGLTKEFEGSSTLQF
jgi:CRISPR-associated endonuclease/helicase Cas3